MDTLTDAQSGELTSAIRQELSKRSEGNVHFSESLTVGRALENSINMALVHGDTHPKTLILRHAQNDSARRLMHGFKTVVVNGLEVLSAVEDPETELPNDSFDCGLSLFRSIASLVIKGTASSPTAHTPSTDHKISGRPSAFFYATRGNIDFSVAHITPTVSTYRLAPVDVSADKHAVGTKRAVTIELMDQDYRKFRRGHRTLEKNTLDGASRSEAEAALIEAGAPPEKVQRILDSVREQTSYVAISREGASMRLQAVGDQDAKHDRVEMTLTLAGNMADVQQVTQHHPGLLVTNTAAGVELKTYIDWPVDKAGSFRGFVGALKSSLVDAATKPNGLAKNGGNHK